MRRKRGRNDKKRARKKRGKKYEREALRTNKKQRRFGAEEERERRMYIDSCDFDVASA